MNKQIKHAAPWGKLSQTDDGKMSFHHLCHHMMDVASCFEALARLPVYYEKLNGAAGRVLSFADISRLSIMVFLHDVGKIAPAFQFKKYDRNSKAPHASDGMSMILQACDDEKSPFHGIVSDLLELGGANEVLTGFSHIFAHHGKPVEYHYYGEPLREIPRMKYDLDEHARQMVIRIREWFPAAFQNTGKMPENPEFWHFVNGLTALADHLGSNSHFFPFEDKFDPNYAPRSRNRTMDILRHIGIDPTNYVLEGSDFKTVSGFDTPNPAQAAMYDVPVDDQLTILESETGSGKTEAALIRYALLYGAGRVSGMYFAVPTRAAAKQLHTRIIKAMERMFGKDGFPEPVLAIPGYIKMGDARALRAQGFEVNWNDGKGNDQSRWVAERADRFLAAKVAVGTVDQAMLSALQTKHAHLRGSALAKNLLVIDEVHASDAYMTAITKQLLDAHLGLGGYALLMSATLGAVARAKWRDEKLPPFAQTVKESYPAIWTGKSEKPIEVEHTGDEKRVHMSEIQSMDPDRVASIAIYHARRGARVLVIRNTVKMAQETLDAVETRINNDFDTYMACLDEGTMTLEEVDENLNLLFTVADKETLHHSRFALEDRELLDENIEGLLTTDTDRPQRGAIVIGTQTLEQSLDIDADFMITDLCPMDVLLQRIGRLHRKKSMPRPEWYRTPRCVVCVHEDGVGYLAMPRYFNGLGAWIDEDTGLMEGNYIDIACLELTRKMIAETHWEIPRMNRYLVESTTHPEQHLALLQEKTEKYRAYRAKLIEEGKLDQNSSDPGPAWVNYYRQMKRRVSSDRRSATIVVLDRSIPLPNSFDGRPGTRLGEMGATLRFPRGTVGPFGNYISQITLPEHWSRGIEDFAEITILPEENKPDTITFSVPRWDGEVQFRYSRQGLTMI